MLFYSDISWCFLLFESKENISNFHFFCCCSEKGNKSFSFFDNIRKKEIWPLKRLCWDIVSRFCVLFPLVWDTRRLFSVFRLISKCLLWSILTNSLKWKTKENICEWDGRRGKRGQIGKLANIDRWDFKIWILALNFSLEKLNISCFFLKNNNEKITGFFFKNLLNHAENLFSFFFRNCFLLNLSTLFLS